MNKLPKKAHFVGICGVATSALAIAMKEAGVEITGSDKGFFPPVSDELKKANISFYAGWHPEKILSGGLPDIAVVGTASGSQNPETALFTERKIPMCSFAEAIGKFLIKEKSIACVGTWGKTSSSALLSFVLEQANWNPSYMFGGISLSHNTSAKITDSKISVVEGDEYKSGPKDNTPKFFYYKPTHLVLSAISWDHADLYKTEKEYFFVFEKLLKSIPENGFIVAQTKNDGVQKILKEYKGKLISYGKENADFIYHSISQNKNGLHFTIENKEKCFEIQSPLLGEFQAENITGVFAVANTLGVNTDTIIKAIKDFKGLKRRMEKRLDKDIIIFDDIAHSPEKVSPILENLRKIFKGKIIAVFEPNIGARKKEIEHKYNDAFKYADIVIIPRLTKLKIGEKEDTPIEGEKLTQIIKTTKKEVFYIPSDEKLVDFIVENVQKGDCIAFLGSHGFRGMIEETVKKLDN